MEKLMNLKMIIVGIFKKFVSCKTEGSASMLLLGPDMQRLYSTHGSTVCCTTSIRVSWHVSSE